MAKKQRNIIDFRNTSQRLFVATWVLMIFVLIITLLNNSNTQSSSEISSYLIVASLAFGIVSAIGSLACKKLSDVIDDRKKALKKSSRIHRCQIYIIVMLFIFLIIMGIALFLYLYMYVIEDKFGDDKTYSIINEDSGLDTVVNPAMMIKQQLIGSIIKIVMAAVIGIIYLVCYMKIVITSGVDRKDFSNLPKNNAKETKTKKTEPKKVVDDSDEYDL